MFNKRPQGGGDKTGDSGSARLTVFNGHEPDMAGACVDGPGITPTNGQEVTIMKIHFTHPLIVALVAVAAAGPPQASAQQTQFSQYSQNVFPQRGQPAVCRLFSVYAKQMRVTGPGAGGTASGGGATADWNIAGGNILDFSDADTDINFAVVRGKSGTTDRTNMYAYAAPGVKADSGLAARDAAGTALPITEFALCHSLAEPLGEPNAGDFNTQIPRCSMAVADEVCGALTGSQVKLVNFVPLRSGANPSDPEQFVRELDPRICFCSGPDYSAQFLNQCDDLLPADAVVPAGAPGPCPSVSAPGAQAAELIEVVNDPYYCRTVGGQRKCYNY